ncbi:MAG: hypothetical protein E6J41_32675 [Chloroflexi bacterium]|nr:MAG: hypothetical protein E6J41_32675 [Chloroflexota bacterium]
MRGGPRDVGDFGVAGGAGRWFTGLPAGAGLNRFGWPVEPDAAAAVTDGVTPAETPEAACPTTNVAAPSAARTSRRDQRARSNTPPCLDIDPLP